MRVYCAVFVLFLSLPLAAQEQTIPLLLSEHHADHMEFFFRYAINFRSEGIALMVLDAHSDTVKNEQTGMIRGFAGSNIYRTEQETGNHNWIYPIAPFFKTLVWVSTIRGVPRSDKLEGFLKSTAAWDTELRAEFSSLEELRFMRIEGNWLFVSVDLDFFYSENHQPDDVPAVLDALFAFSSRWKTVWAICLSRPWLPDDRYAWNLLEKTLLWLKNRPEFYAPEITLFNSRIVDTSRTAQAYRADGREPPALREEDMPEQIKALIQELQSRNSPGIRSYHQR